MGCQFLAGPQATKEYSKSKQNPISYVNSFFYFLNSFSSLFYQVDSLYGEMEQGKFNVDENKH